MTIEIKVRKIHPDAKIPSYAHPDDAGMDLCSVEEYLLKPLGKIIIKTGIQMEIPSGYFGSIRDRSGMAAKLGIHTLAGVIDSGYRGEIGVVLVNLGKEDFKINKGDRVAQIIIKEYTNCKITESETLGETARGDGGFGSTGR